MSLAIRQPRGGKQDRRNNSHKDREARKSRVTRESDSGFCPLHSGMQGQRWQRSHQDGGDKRLPEHLRLTKPGTGRKIPSKRMT